jgi:O-antigen ligase
MYSDRAIETLRSTQWQFTWELIQDRPFLGWGLRNFTPLYQTQMEIWLGHPHNLPLMLSAEIGLPGLMLLLGLVGSIIIRGSKLVMIWSDLSPTPGAQQWQQDQLMFLTFIIAFCALSLFNLLDVTLFDLRLNLLAWVLLAAINGASHHYRQLELGVKLIR